LYDKPCGRFAESDFCRMNEQLALPGSKLFYRDVRLGLLGGGQLGRMILRSALDLNVHVRVLDPDPNAPCARFADEFTVGDFRNFDTVLAFGQGCDVLTIEIEDVNVEALQVLAQQGVQVFPSAEAISTIQDKGLQKRWLAQRGFPTAAFEWVADTTDLHALFGPGPFGEAPEWHFPSVLKLRRGGFDGRGVQLLRSENDLQLAWDAPCILEQKVDIVRELAVVVARNTYGETASYPTVEMEFNPEANLVEFLFSPSSLSPELEAQAQQLARSVAEQLNLVGTLAVELFLTTSGQLLVNELAPRVHNSGHHTLGASHTSQFEQHLRAVLGLPLGSTGLKLPAVMVNVLGAPGHSGPVVYRGIEEVLRLPGLRVHLYGKTETRPFRKMGHLTVLAATLAEAKAIARQAQQLLRVEAD
jgi:5-(carboxyamino)imidazole ribonucleotide synthase